MKEYIKPTFEFIELRTEERLALSCTLLPGVGNNHCGTGGQGGNIGTSQS